MVSCAKQTDDDQDLSRFRAHYELASASFERGDLIPALSSTLEALRIHEKSFEAHNLLGLIYFRQKKVNESEQAFKSALALEPKRAEAWNNLGTLYYQEKRYSEALAAFDKALENPLYLYPERIYNNRGLVFEALKRRDEAVESYQRAIDYGKGIYLPSQNLGRLFFQEGRFDRAKRLLEDASRLCKECSEPRYYLGQTLLKLSQRERAEAIFREGAAVDPEGYYGELCARNLVP